MRQNINQSYIESFANELSSKFRRINHLTTSARTAIGNYHEEVLRVAIQNFLSKRYSIKTGYIYFDSDNISNQIDILIIDENYTFSYLFQEGNFVIVKPDAVICAIEVKSVLNKKNFEEAFLNITKSKEVKQKSLTGALTGLIFGYESPTTSNKWLEKCFLSDKLDAIKDKESFWPNSVIFFEKADLLIFDTQGSNDKGKNKYYSRLYKETDFDRRRNFKVNKSYKLAVFISWILGALAGNEVSASGRFVENHFSQIVDHTGQMLGIDGFRIGLKRKLKTVD
ncbi:MAG: DUF6602 domain-containing protein [bacterium]